MPKRQFIFNDNADYGGTKKRVKAAATIQKAFRKKRMKSKPTYGQAGPEFKYLDTNVAVALPPDSTAVVVGISNMAQGLTNITRVGNKIQIKSVEVKITLFNEITFAHSPNAHRVSLVLDKEPEPAALASYNQIYTDDSVLSMRNIGESDRFVVLAVEEFITDGALATTQTVNGTIFKTMFRNVDIASKFSGTGATQANVATNQLLVCIESFVDDANADWYIRSRIRYTDE